MTTLDRLTVSVAGALIVGLAVAFTFILGAELVAVVGRINTVIFCALVSVAAGLRYGWKERGWD